MVGRSSPKAISSTGSGPAKPPAAIRQPSMEKSSIFSATPPNRSSQVKATRLIRVYAKLEHADDFGAATKALREQGYGADESAVDLSGILAAVTPQEADRRDDHDAGTSNAKEGEVANSGPTGPLIWQPSTDIVTASEAATKNFLTRLDQINMKSPRWLFARECLNRTRWHSSSASRAALRASWRLIGGCRIASGTPWART